MSTIVPQILMLIVMGFLGYKFLSGVGTIFDDVGTKLKAKMADNVKSVPVPASVTNGLRNTLSTTVKKTKARPSTVVYSNVSTSRHRKGDDPYTNFYR